MVEPIIKIKKLSKRYRIGAKEEGYKTFKESIMDGIKAPIKNIKNLRNLTKFASSSSSGDEKDILWALKDISFEVREGEIIGIIGRNGAGKTTLLKILSRITEPTKGYVEIRGRVSSLLEVGTGFHPELTGRENIYLNGTILGMRKKEIDSKFDEIVAFAETEKFLDTPVKRYSSGMYVRLAFAVAAHLEPEILIVDEVLAVGDYRFQKKCLGKINEVAKGGRTVLFVSHNLSAISNLCSCAVLLDKGQLLKYGPVEDVIQEYTGQEKKGSGERVWNELATAPGNDKIRLHAVRIVSNNEVTSDVDIQQDIHFKIEFWNFKQGARITTFIHILDKMGTYLLVSANMRSISLGMDKWFNKPYPIGLFETTCVLPGNFLNVGFYSINISIQTDITLPQSVAKEAIFFTVHDNRGACKEYSGIMLGAFRPKLTWQTKYLRPCDG